MNAELNKAITAVMAEVHSLKKAEKNEHGKYNYVSVDAFKDFVRPLMAKNGLSLSMTEVDFALETVNGRNGSTATARITFEFIMRHISGEVDAPERATIMLPYTGAQTAGAAKSYALKEYMKGKFLVSTGDKDLIEGGADADAYKPQEYTGAEPPAPVEAPQKYERSGIVRDEFERIQKGIHQIEQTGTLEDLSLFWKNNAKTISKLPADWRTIIEEAKEEAKEGLSAKVPA